MNESKQENTDTPEIKAKFDKFWIDLNEATTMRPKAKAQIYSVNEDLPVNQVARMWGVLDQLERTREKKRMAKPPTRK